MKRDFILFSRLWNDARHYKMLIFLTVAMVPISAVVVSIQPLLLQYVIDQGILAGELDVVMQVGSLMLGLVFIRFFSQLIRSVASGKVVFCVIRDLRKKMMQHLLKLRLSYHDRTQSGTLVTRTTSDFDQLSESIGSGLLNAIVDLTQLLGCLLGLWWLDHRLMFISLFWVLCFGFIVRFFSVMLRKTTLLARKKIAVMHAFAQEALYGVVAVKVLAAATSVSTWYRERAEDYRNAQMKSVVLDAGLFAVLDGGFAVTLGVSLWLLADVLSFDMSAGVLIAFVRYQQDMFLPLKQLGSLVASLQSALTALERIYGLFDHEEFVKGDQALIGSNCQLSFKNVSFQYGDGPKILNQVSFELKQGQSVAIVGRTGSGKSTLAKLILKLYEGFDGDICWGQQNLKDLDVAAVRREIAVVPQDVVLFQGSLQFNLDPLGLYDDVTLRKKCFDLNLSSWIESLPNGFETVLRERGDNLSQGQRQIVAFARALMKPSSFLILDEATSSVDPQSEEYLQSILEKQNQTLLVIAHRLKTIQLCDQILVIEKGSVVEAGSWEQLIAKGGSFAALQRAMGEQEDLPS
ncbi:MAG: ABC transporter ATP-binding protein [Oligoflexales bacterium]